MRKHLELSTHSPLKVFALYERKVLLRRWDWTPCGSPRHLSRPKLQIQRKLKIGTQKLGKEE